MKLFQILMTEIVKKNKRIMHITKRNVIFLSLIHILTEKFVYIGNNFAGHEIYIVSHDGMK